MHDASLEKQDGITTDYNFFAKETWFFILALILTHVGAIKIDCINKVKKLNPRSLNTNVIECFLMMAGNW